MRASKVFYAPFITNVVLDVVASIALNLAVTLDDDGFQTIVDGRLGIRDWILLYIEKLLF